MKKLFRNRTALAAVSIVLALVICFAVAPAVNAANSRQTDVVRVVQPISKGAKITKSMVQATKEGGYNLPSNTLKSADQAIGKYALADLQPGDNILSTKVNSKSPYGGLSTLDGTEQAVSVTIKSFASGLSGKLQPGDIISFYVADYGDMKATLAPPELQYVQVITTTNNKGVDRSDTNQTGKNASNSDDMPSTITVLATQAQTVKLVDYEKNGTLHAALAYRGTETNAAKFINAEKEYLDSQMAKSSQSQSNNSVESGGTNSGK